MQPSARRAGTLDERGQVLPWIAVMFVVLLAMAGIVIDLGNAYRVHQQLQATADAAAAAGADNLPSTGNAVAAASAYSAAPGGKNLISGAGTVTESAYADCSTDPVHCNGANTVHVTETVSMQTTFLRVLGINSIPQTVRASACSPCGGAPLDLMIVLDRTNSMSAFGTNGKTQLQNAKDGILSFLESMDPALDDVGLAVLPPANSTSAGCSSLGSYSFPGGTYDLSSAAYTIVPLNNQYASSLGNLNSSSTLVSTVNCVRAVGSTAYANALDAAVAELNAHGRPNTQKVIVFLSDGGANDGPGFLASTSNYLINPCGQAVSIANAAEASKIQLYSIAYNTGNEACFMAPGAKRSNGKLVKDTEYRSYLEPDSYSADDALQDIASPGNYYYQPDPTSLITIFNHISSDIAAGTSRING